jgi:ferredoxin
MGDPEFPRPESRRPAGAAQLPVVVDRDRCIGSGMCIVYAPNTFAHDEHTKAVVVDPCADSIDAIRTAVQACPTHALHLVTGDEHGEGA